jgi:predicted RNase H-like HicB family nuclease
MRNVIQFNIEKEKNGLYVASGINAPIVTDGKTFEELQKNIKEAVALFLEEKKKDFVKSPAIIANFEFTNLIYA